MQLTKSVSSDLLKSRAKEALNKIEEQLRTGQLNTEQDLVTSINSAWKSVFSEEDDTSVVVPSYREGELPLKEMLETPFYQASDDIDTQWNKLDLIRKRLADLFNALNSEISGLNDLLKQVQNKATTFQLFASDSESLFLWASDSFTSTDKIDLAQTNAFIDTANGVATLGIVSLDNLNKYISSFLVDKNNSSGIPGNNMEVASITPPSSPDSSTPEPTVTLSGGTDLHSLIGYAFDQNPSTWFEWENIYIKNPQKLKQKGTAYLMDPAEANQDVLDITKGYGWNKFIQWPGDSTWDTNNDKGYPIANFKQINPAKLVFTITLDQPRRVSTITITPHLIQGTYPIVRSLAVSNDGVYYKEIAKDVYLTKKLNESLNASKIGVPEGNYSGTGIWSLEDKTIQYIRVALEADNSYTPPLGLGHHYYFQIYDVRKEFHVLFVSTVRHITEVDRLPNPDSVVQMGDKGGIKIDSKTLLITAGAAIGSIIPGVGTVVGGLIGSVVGSLIGGSTTKTLVRSGDAYDVFDGNRSVISLQDIDISIREYTSQSQIVSKAFYFAQPLKAVSIISTEIIPDSWDQNTEWISFFISTDGYTWTKIIPQNRSNGSNDTVFVNGATNIYVKVLLTGNSADKNSTPILANYAIKALPN